jgi:hypothetical protein
VTSLLPKYRTAPASARQNWLSVNGEQVLIRSYLAIGVQVEQPVTRDSEPSGLKL